MDKNKHTIKKEEFKPLNKSINIYTYRVRYSYFNGFKCKYTPSKIFSVDLTASAGEVLGSFKPLKEISVRDRILSKDGRILQVLEVRNMTLKVSDRETNYIIWKDEVEEVFNGR